MVHTLEFLFDLHKAGASAFLPCIRLLGGRREKRGHSLGKGIGEQEEGCKPRGCGGRSRNSGFSPRQVLDLGKAHWQGQG